MLEKKSDNEAERLKAEANATYSNGDYLEALKLYNKALCYAESKEKLSLIYGNRSAVYFALNRYKECLANIDLAKQHGYPLEKIQKLIEREKKCKNQSDTVKLQEERAQNVKNLLKLSHPAKPKVPFIADCLEMRYTKNFGRGIYTTRNLVIGDVIAIERPIFTRIDVKGLHLHCINCFDSNMLNLIPCKKSASLMFCSETCRDKAYEKFPDLEVLHPSEDGRMNHRCYERMIIELDHAFGGRDNLMKFIQANNFQKFKKTVFDFDFTDHSEYDKNLILSSLSLMTEIKNRAKTLEISHFSKVFAEGNQLLEKFLRHVMSVSSKNCTKTLAVSTVSNHQFSGLLTFHSMMNHACWPNVHFSYVSNKLVAYVGRSIKAGEQLFFNYMFQHVNLPRDQRRAILNETHFFTCNCYLCKHNLTPPNCFQSKGDPIVKGMCDTISMTLGMFNQCKKGDGGGLALHLLLETIETARNRTDLLINDRSKEDYEFQQLMHMFFDTVCILHHFPAVI